MVCKNADKDDSETTLPTSKRFAVAEFLRSGEE
jgi:hypothetical protein